MDVEKVQLDQAKRYKRVPTKRTYKELKDVDMFGEEIFHYLIRPELKAWDNMEAYKQQLTIATSL